MAYYEWTKALDMGVEPMNSEHKILISHMNDLYDLNARSAPKDEVLREFDGLMDYAVEHFRDEEKFMDSIRFPSAAHKKLHVNLLN